MSMFTRRHYLWLAEALRYSTRELHCDCPACDACMIIESFADELAAESEGFNRELFINHANPGDASCPLPTKSAKSAN